MHPQYYKDTGVKPEDTRAPDYSKWTPSPPFCHRPGSAASEESCGLRTSGAPTSPTSQGCRQWICTVGKPTRLCFSNPYYRNFLSGLVEDYVRSYDIDGIMWCSENSGALRQRADQRRPGPRRVFLRELPAKAKKTADRCRARVRLGYRALSNFCVALRPASGL